jgi:hypothetical protein
MSAKGPDPSPDEAAGRMKLHGSEIGKHGADIFIFDILEVIDLDELT